MTAGSVHEQDIPITNYSSTPLVGSKLEIPAHKSVNFVVFMPNPTSNPCLSQGETPGEKVPIPTSTAALDFPILGVMVFVSGGKSIHVLPK